jgi:hypothetical protein
MLTRPNTFKDGAEYLIHAMAQLVDTLRYKAEGLGFDSRWCHWNFLFDVILSVALWPWD